MTECTIEAKCANCGKPILTSEKGWEQKPCPACGSLRKLVEICAEERMEIHDGVRVRAYRNGFMLMEQKVRTKRSKRGVLAQETLVIDRSHPEKTVKVHQVKERAEDGRWRIVHDECVEFPAKRRPEGWEKPANSVARSPRG